MCCILFHIEYYLFPVFQVIIDGIGVFSIVLGKDFVRSGFMHPSIYLLLQNLICSENQIRNASDAVLRALAASCSYPTVSTAVIYP